MSSNVHILELLVIGTFNKNESLKGHVKDIGHLGRRVWSNLALTWKLFVSQVATTFAWSQNDWM